MGSITHAVPRRDGDLSVTIVADDLSGATDSAVACAKRGLNTVVALVDVGGCGAEAVAFDTDTRRRTGDAAVAETARFIHAHAKARGGLLFKKVDSTLRGHVGLEIAALLQALRDPPHRASGGRTIAVLAPAFPALGRTTLHGRQHLNGMPLENTELWRLEGLTGSGSLLDMMSSSDLESKLVPIGTVRHGAHAIRAAMTDVSGQTDVLVCDAETDEDLAAVAQASLKIGVDLVWVGSAGLIGHLLDAVGISRPRANLPQFVASAGPLLFVVGSQSSVSRRQAERLAAEDVVTFTIEGTTLDYHAAYGTDLAIRLSAALAAGKDVLLLSTPKAAARRPDALCTMLRALIAPHAGSISGVFATGGETARAVLMGLGIMALRPIAEVERGIPLSVAVGPRRFPVITKAGAFGDVTTMLTCRRVLRQGGLPAPSPAPHTEVRL
jgi:D-threonate/D-erythronate kinase